MKVELKQAIYTVKNVALNQILGAVSEAYDMPIGLINSKAKQSEIVKARQMAMYLMRMETDCTLEKVGWILGGRKPATITHGFQRVASLKLTDDETRRMINRTKIIMGQSNERFK